MKQADLRELALKKVKITGDVIGKFGSFSIEQTYLNNSKDVLEVGYTFPIVETATVVGFEIHVGDKILKGVCKEKEEAKEEYTRNLVKGNSSYLMEQETDNIFRISVGKIDKNEEVTVIINYIDKFEIVDNTIQIMMPTLITPRYKSEITDKLSYAKVDYTIDFDINIDKKIKRKSITCPTHEISLIDEAKFERVSVKNYDMSKDFKLEIELKKELASSAITSKTKDGKDAIYLSFMPEVKDDFSNVKRNFVFVVDISGSMMGEKLEQTKKAVIECLKQLKEGDKFNIIIFESRFSVMSLDSLEYNEKNYKIAEEFVKNLRARGGTEIYEPVKYALDGDDKNKVVLLFTDGQVGNENQILEYITNNIRSARLFAFGIDNNVNSSFIKGMSKKGNGKAELITATQNLEENIIRQFKRIQMPMVEDVKIDYGKSHLDDEIKEETTLFNYEFFNVLAVVDELKDDIILKGKIFDKEYSWKISKEDIDKSKVDLEILYAKEQIRRLDEYILNTIDTDSKEQYKKMIVELATKNNINSKYTSFISVYERDEKIHDVPKHQETTLSNGFLKGVLNGFLGNVVLGPDVSYEESGAIVDGDTPMRASRASGIKTSFAGMSKMMSKNARVSSTRELMDVSPVIDDYKSDETHLKELIRDYRKDFEKSDNKAFLTSMLFYVYNQTADAENSKQILKLINDHFEEIMSDMFLQAVMIKALNRIGYILDKEEIKKVLGDKYSEKYFQNFEVVLNSKSEITPEEIHELAKKDKLNNEEINKAIWTFISRNDLDLEEI